jgi:glycosyltransferase involved in cell wall biosynthesis
MGKQDGVERLVDMMDYIVREKGRTDIVLKLMGTGPELETIRRKAEAAGVSGSIVFTGWVSGKEYVEHLASCDVCVNADIVNDYNNLCSSNKIYEYMFFAKPIVQFPMAENSYLAEGACLFARPNDYRDMGDRVLELAGNEALREELGAKGRRRFLDLFTWERSEERLLEAYERVISPPATTPSPASPAGSIKKNRSALS